ncbi:YhcN/YlaJ family sporulation lipoprotein [Aquibacillus sp. 3ASR75-11]|uniref:YhcN/YlaJ family sporulation lipoprotein n=1 Tax=Terrihalobacillus insolitus TaxID=2950438 RepID=A0A9X3WRY2_9BACI|nr:YhcN/YlaJ family sporulation lipoprotein [Terrihalobacillus insolitus]MDC3412790.1 YhcN/YlaJ family sporulation lipoprotein [Terrihalobacillus insolitus]MDC3423733.1 YhcN/YlaJ family sporulation lipoprotein [Terrihalobacillus insolitus]
MGKRTFIISAISFTTLFLVACQEEESLPNQKNQNPTTIQVKDSDPIKKQTLSNEQIANHLADLANDVPNVQGATSVVAGSYAVVGIDVDKDLDRSRVGTIKYTVLEALQEDPYGKTAIVIADADGTERIKQMADKIEQGHPIQGVVDELSAIVGRYMPEFPINEDQPSEPDQNEEVIPKEDEKELDQIQDDQSNNKINESS